MKWNLGTEGFHFRSESERLDVPGSLTYLNRSSAQLKLDEQRRGSARSPGVGVEGDVERLVDGREQVHRLPSRSSLLRLRRRPSAPAGQAPASDLRRPAPPPPRHLPQRLRGHRHPRSGVRAELRSPGSREWERLLDKQLTLLLCSACTSSWTRSRE